MIQALAADTADLAYEAAFARHWRDVFRFALAWTNDWGAAEDLTQETFIRVFRSVQNYQPGTFEGWLHRITTNLFLDGVRRRQRIRFDGLPENAEDRFPGREQRERIPVPDGVLKESLPGRENYLQEERRLFYVAMTRARCTLHLTWARDYGVKRLKKIWEGLSH